MNTIVIVFVILGMLVLWLSMSKESFWGGYFPVPYAGQPIKYYGRTGLDAATDDPKMLINVNACSINPTF